MNLFRLNLAVSIALIIAGFLCPPIGVIDGSVLAAVGLLLMFSVIAKIPEAIRSGRNIKVQKGDSSVVITSGNSDCLSDPS